MTMRVRRCSLPFAASLLHALLHFRAHPAAVAQFGRSNGPVSVHEKSR